MSTLSAVVLAALSVCARHYTGPLLNLFGGQQLSVACLSDDSCSYSWWATQKDSWPPGDKKCATIYAALAMQRYVKQRAEQQAHDAALAAKKKAANAKLRKKAAADQPILAAAVRQLQKH